MSSRQKKAWFYVKGSDGRAYILAMVNAKGSCSMRAFDASDGKFLGRPLLAIPTVAAYRFAFVWPPVTQSNPHFETSGYTLEIETAIQVCRMSI